MKIDVYYDISCDFCAKSASTDWGQGAFISREVVKIWAKKTSWKTKDGNNICPVCQVVEKVRDKLKKCYDDSVVDSVILEHYIHTNSWVVRCGLVDIDVVKSVIERIDFKSSSVKVFQ